MSGKIFETPMQRMPPTMAAIAPAEVNRFQKAPRKTAATIGGVTNAWNMP